MAQGQDAPGRGVCDRRIYSTYRGAKYLGALLLGAYRGKNLCFVGKVGTGFDGHTLAQLSTFTTTKARLFGVDTRARDVVASAALLEALTPLFGQRVF
jgi:ATP-dependent DNA ligase